ncbi:hypothetical protein CHL67_06130 [Prosthecochloris sp. GSB1]|nr:hypothetical protein CHL67_06130 [Prosthecochloris sp. GSB1]
MKNLDYLAAKHAQKLAEQGDMETTVTKALGVLQEHGVYACFLYLLAKEKEGNKGKSTAGRMIGLLQESGLVPDEAIPEKPTDILHYVNEHISSAKLKKLLLIKDLLELMLVYSRYHANAMEPAESTEESI